MAIELEKGKIRKGKCADFEEEKDARSFESRMRRGLNAGLNGGLNGELDAGLNGELEAMNGKKRAEFVINGRGLKAN